MNKQRILFLFDDTVAAPVRMGMPGEELKRRGWNITLKSYHKTMIQEPEQYDVVVLQRPINNLMDIYGRLRGKHRRIIVDLDDDFLAIPKEHPGYKDVGRGNPEAIDNLLNQVGACDTLVVSTEELKLRYAPVNSNVVVIPNHWDDHNQAWKSRPSKYGMVNVGWCGSLTHQKDQVIIRRAMEEIARKYAYVCLVIGADQDFYRQFTRVPESQKCFIPGLNYPEYPWMLRHMDVLLAPLEDTEFNAAKSDIKLIEAGAAGIPYLASDVPCYRGWQSLDQKPGGLLVGRYEWFNELDVLVSAEGLRQQMGQQGHINVDKRRISKMVAWEEVLDGQGSSD